uniref:hypothetical protein n=1 Tax=Paractinoplanes polyasparticus TaxID=2856853 RepID=UPI001C84A303|nr:hypothetical protein [Actinoplanes polyasparticus]
MSVALQIPFRHHDRDGQVSVLVTKVVNGIDAGFDILPGLPFGPETAAGYPSMSATVSYEGAGYRKLTGWIQVVHTRRTWDHANEVVASEVDSGPVWAEADSPFFAHGYPAAIYDAPSNNLNGAHHLEWRADTFLVTVPLRSRSEPITLLASFAWGYNESADPKTAPSIVAPVATSRERWHECSEVLERGFPAWRWA